LAEAYLSLDWYGADSPATLLPRASEAAKIALTIDDSDPIARGAQATLYAAWDFDWPKAEAEFGRALAVGSGLSSTYFYYALDFLTPLGKLEAAEDAIRTALELDPLSPLLSTALGGCLYRQRHFQAAARHLKEFVEQYPDFGLGHWGLGRALEQLGAAEASIHCYGRALDLLGNLPAVQGDLGHILAANGKRDEAVAILRRLEEVAESRYVSPLCFASVWLGLEDYEKAVGAVRQAVAQRDHPVLWVLVDPRFDRPALRPALLEALMPTGLSSFFDPQKGEHLSSHHYSL
jgi:tetratricopeptide (TPR) repeat protein